ncbi:unnamed protein product [Arabidopsis lyrata]|uniref:SET domain-containing protein n=1 Tax=Arabidopsis lyrata subsp. lyrata TaxID=81972 RepID=D7LHT0_ARALL|nr:histone-lysine N-methyltransferase, H3 lysine-9 specific SUVH5 [Arabidopsis lyrata subsp. lyrata]EFH55793.1 hypothetical protein ARALYDRAFT_902613 [Arabidopsis lyrata subsp. lyrata]CAH8264785.1 unnamed protein product [Arabidopsis lyrata]|eukprot:XP_002879534.1 histone-lysine N-methyltransferase, H3 lysine-9 specific SUVH5 [Arabidopsis lyrata subsp. lyrata]
MVHSESSKLISLRGGSGPFSKDELATNGSYTDPMGRRKSKRFKVAAESEFSPDCGSGSMRLRSRTIQKEVQIETCENKNASEVEVELIPGEKVADRDGFKSVDCNDMSAGGTEGAKSLRVNMQEPMEGRNLPENTSEQNLVEVHPPSISLPEEDVVGSVCRKSITGTKELRGRTVSVVRDLSPNMGSKFSKSGKTAKGSISMEEDNLVLEKSDSGDHLGQSLSKSISPEVLELDKSKVTVPKPIEAAVRIITNKGVAMPPPLKPSEKTNGDYGEGSMRKNSERVAPDKKRLARNPRLSNGGLPSGSSSGESARYKVKETLRLFHETCKKIMQEEEARPRKRDGSKFRVDNEASKILKGKGKNLNSGTQIIGTVPGVEVGDEFQYRMEMNFLGIHRPSQSGIDYMKDDGEELVATSIVSSGGYDDVVDNSDVLIYTGQGGNVGKKGKKNNEPKDQQLVTGNLALKNSIHKKNPVRVIRGIKNTTLQSSAVAKNYVYDGLYLVEEYWDETGSHGKLVFKFKLRRIPGQPELPWKVVEKSKKSEFRDGLCNVDISEGKETLPICAVNNIDDEKPAPFIYTVKMIYPDWCRPIPPKSCGCTKRCSESKKCACVVKNGGEIPYNYDGAIVSIKPLVYECGPHCQCPPSCYMRVSQHGIKIKLEIFKTESRGWGVRSLESIPIGSFICEYAGELLEDKQAERLTGKDEYLFELGEEEDQFTIDAARKGNIGRFINHSCSPNLYAQDVLYDHEDTRIPHIMFFALDHIPPLEELSYDYNYKIDQVTDSNGNIKKKICYCGSAECSGRLY